MSDDVQDLATRIRQVLERAGYIDWGALDGEGLTTHSEDRIQSANERIEKMAGWIVSVLQAAGVSVDPTPRGASGLKFVFNPANIGRDFERGIGIHSTDEEDWTLAHVPVRDGSGVEIARRIVACWNACDGLSTEHLEDRARTRESSPDGLVAAVPPAIERALLGRDEPPRGRG